MANRNALIASVIARTDAFEAAELAGQTNRLAMIAVGLADAEADCYSAGINDPDIWGQLADTAVSL